MTNFNPLNFIASHAGMNLADVAVIMFCLVCIVYLYGMDYLLDLTDKEMNRVLKCEIMELVEESE